jgi:hypothetical protein
LNDPLLSCLSGIAVFQGHDWPCSPRAYAIWEQEGRPDGKQLEHWVQAKRLIAAEELRAAAGVAATHPRFLSDGDE